MNSHCPGCLQHGKIHDLKAISVKGDDCPGLDVGLEREKLLGTINDLQAEMNRIIRQKWDVEGELAANKAAIRERVKDEQSLLTQRDALLQEVLRLRSEIEQVTAVKRASP